MDAELVDAWKKLLKDTEKRGLPGPGRWTPRPAEGQGSLSGCYRVADNPTNPSATADERLKVAREPLISTFATLSHAPDT